MFYQSGELVKYLQKWTCNRANLQECLLQMYIDLYEVSIVEESEVLYMFAWLQDLIAMGYRFPKLQTSMPIHWKKEDWVRIRLCIQFNTENAVKEETMRLLHRVYSNFFSKISYSGPIPKPDFLGNDTQYIHCTNAQNGEFQHHCLLAHLQTYPDADGYLYVADDAFIDLSRLSKLPRDKVWYLHGTDMDIRKPRTFDVKIWPIWPLPEGYHALKHYVENLPEAWKERLQAVNGDKNIVRTIELADVIYIPEQLRSKYASAIRYFSGEPQVNHEVITAVIRDLVVGNDYVPLIPACLWAEQNNFEEQSRCGVSGDFDFVHPLKLSDPKVADLWSSLMDDVGTSMI